MKNCKKCGEQDPSKFTENNKSGYCKPCQKEYAAEHYRKNKEKYAETQRKNRPLQTIEWWKWFTELKTNVSCTDCVIIYLPCIIDFDHLDGHKKRDKVSRMVNTCYAKEEILKEIAKCEPVCGNCHRDRTYKRLFLKNDGFSTTRNTVLYVQDYKTKHSCVDCKKYYNYWIMDFDHKLGEIKLGNIGEMVYRYSLETIINEIKKCELLCANCHRVRTIIDENWKIPLNGGQPVLKTGVV